MSDYAYTASFREVFWGLTLLIVTIFLHAQTTLFAVTVYRHEPGQKAKRPNRGVALVGLLSVGCLLGVGHAIDVTLWASFFTISGCFKTFSTSLYVALANYTTVGCNVEFPAKWRLLGPMSAGAGMLMFGWSAAILVLVAQRFRGDLA